MFAYYTNTKVAEIRYERLQIKMKDTSVREDEIQLVADLKNAMPPELFNKLQFESRFRDHIVLLDFIVSSIFYIVILITLFLMFFSLSATMTSNIYEQAKEIGSLRAIGF